MKELDDSTLRLVRQLASDQERLWARYSVRLFVIWVGGDKEALAAWAARHKINDLPLGVIGAEDETLNPWRISKRARSTTVLLVPLGGAAKPVATLVNLEAGDPTKFMPFEKKVDEHFRRWRGD